MLPMSASAHMPTNLVLVAARLSFAARAERSGSPQAPLLSVLTLIAHLPAFAGPGLPLQPFSGTSATRRLPLVLTTPSTTIQMMMMPTRALLLNTTRAIISPALAAPMNPPPGL